MPDIDEHSPEFLFGKILERLTGLDKRLTAVANKFDSLHCIAQDSEIQNIGQWIEGHEKKHAKMDEQAQFTTRSRIKLRDGLIIGAVSAAIGALSEWLVVVFTKSQDRIVPIGERLVHLAKALFHV